MKNTHSAKGTNAMDKKEEVQQSNDKHISQDFEGYPKSPARENIINPKTKADRLTAKTEKPAEGTKKNPLKKKSDKPGEPNEVEEKLAGKLGTTGKTSDTPNKVDRIKKETKWA